MQDFARATSSPCIMENNEHMHAVMWAARAQRAVLPPFNTHLTAVEGGLHHRQFREPRRFRLSCQARSILQALCRRTSLTSYRHSRIIVTRNSRRLTIPRMVSSVADRAPIDDEREGDLLQYSSGTTGQPKGIRRPLSHKTRQPDTPHPLLSIDDAARDHRRHAVYLNPAPLYHTAPAVLVHGRSSRWAAPSS